MKIRKAVIPAAGFGTRFLPATKSVPKEMLTIVDTPVIQYVVEEAVSSGITDILIIISKGKSAIQEHFNRNFELEKALETKNRSPESESLKRISSMANIQFAIQKEMRGLGDAISLAKEYVANEPFAVLLGDTLMKSNTNIPVTEQLLNVFDRYQKSVIALEEVPLERVSKYGVVEGGFVEDNLVLARNLVEKPAVEEARSNLVVASRYILTPEIFDHLANVKPGKNAEIQLTDALQALVKTDAIYGLKINGTRFDVGNKLGFLKTNIVYAFECDDIRDSMAEFILSIANTLK